MCTIGQTRGALARKTAPNDWTSTIVVCITTSRLAKFTSSPLGGHVPLLLPVLSRGCKLEDALASADSEGCRGSTLTDGTSFDDASGVTVGEPLSLALPVPVPVPVLAGSGLGVGVRDSAPPPYEVPYGSWSAERSVEDGYGDQ